MPVSTTITNFDVISGYVYRACWMTEQLNVQGLITPAQAAAVLASWNGNIKALAGPIALSLPSAAAQTQEALATWWNTPGVVFKIRCFNFGNDMLAQFPEEQPDSHPCSNWGLLIEDLASTF